MAKKLVREAIIEALIAEGVEVVFGLPGGQSVATITEPLYDYQDKIKSVLARDERSATFMAAGYTQATHKPCMVYGTLGPGFGNLIPGMYEAYRGKWPIIFMAPSTPQISAGLGSMQEVPQVEVVKPIMKWTWHLEIPEMVNWMMRRAFTEACSGVPGPVFLEVPTGMGGVEVELEDYEKSTRVVNSAPDDAAINEAVDMIMKAKKPVIIAGAGVHMSQAWEELQKFAEILGIIVATTSSGKAAIPEDHALAIGMHGHVGSQWTNEYVDTADLVFWIGSGMEDLSTHGYTRGRGRGKLLVCNVSVSDATKNWAPDLVLWGDAKLTLQKLIKRAEEVGPHKPYMELDRVKQLLKEKEKWEKALQAERDSYRGKFPMEVGRVCEEIAKQIPDNVFLVPDSGFNSFFAQSYPHLKLKKAGNYAMHSEYFHIGFAVPAAIGVALAVDDPVVAIVGDGGFHYVMPEIASAVQEKVPVIFFVMDNHSIGWIKYWQKVMHDQRYLNTDFEPPIDFAKVAEACSCKAITIEREEELAEGVKKAFEIQKSGEPVLVHCRVNWDTQHWGSDYTTNLYKTGTYKVLKEKVVK